jgi:hypothetical protein
MRPKLALTIVVAALFMSVAAYAWPCPHRALTDSELKGIVGGLKCQVGGNGPGCAGDPLDPCWDDGSGNKDRCQFTEVSNDDCGNYTGAVCVGTQPSSPNACGWKMDCDPNCENCQIDLGWTCSLNATVCY